MDVWEHLVANSTLSEGDGDAWEHLINPSGEGGGGITINTNVTSIMEENAILLSELPSTTPLIKEVIVTITEIENITSIQEIPKELLDGNGIC